MGSAPARGNTCAGLVEGFGIGSVQTTMVYNRDTADADSNGPGSTWGRTHNSRYMESMASIQLQLQAPSSATASDRLTTSDCDQLSQTPGIERRTHTRTRASSPSGQAKPSQAKRNQVKSSRVESSPSIIARALACDRHGSDNPLPSHSIATRMHAPCMLGSMHSLRCGPACDS